MKYLKKKGGKHAYMYVYILVRDHILPLTVASFDNKQHTLTNSSDQHESTKHFVL